MGSADTQSAPDPLARGTASFEDKGALLAAIINSSQEAIISKTIEGTITSWNPAAEQIYGWSAEEVIGRSISVIIPPERSDEFENLLNRIADGEPIPPFETVRMCKDGRRIPVLVSISSIKDPAGNVIGTSSLATCLERQKEVEEESRLIEERFKIAATTLGICAWQWCLRTNRIVWSENLESVHRIQPGTFQGSLDAYIALIHPSHRDDILRQIRRAIDEQKPFCVEYRLRADENAWIESNGRLLFDNDPSPNALMAICIDVTARKRAEEASRAEAALRASEARFRELAEAMPHMVWIARPDGTIAYANRHFYEYTGATDVDTVTEGSRRYIHPEELPRVNERWAEIFNSETPQELEFRLLGKHGSFRWHLARLVPICNQQGKITHWIGSTTDIDAQKRATQELKALTRTLERRIADRTHELNDSVHFLEDFLYSIGHHLRAPLRAIDGFTRALIEDSSFGFDEEGRQNAHRITAAALRMDDLLKDLLAFGRISHEELLTQSVDLTRVAHQVVAESWSRIEEKSARVELEESMPFVWANPSALHTILSNLLSNALKFTRPGRTPIIRIEAERTDGMVRIWICDNGIGIQRDYLNQIFRPFERLHGYDEYVGTGIGLAIVRRAAERMGGKVGVESQLGEGSSFWVELPLDQEMRPPSPITIPELDFLPATDCLIITDINGRIVWVNEAFTRTCGYTLAQALGQKPGFLLQGAATDPIEKSKVHDAIRDRKRLSVAILNYRANGEPYWNQISLGPVRKNGQWIGFVAVTREVSLPIPDSVKVELRRELRKVLAGVRKLPQLL